MSDDRMADSAPVLFPTTRWSQIRPGAASDGEREAAALESLAQQYWRPIRAYLRTALAQSSEDSSDLAQDFFVWMLETGFLGKADPSRGRFRAFVKTALRHYVADGNRRKRADKRGGERRFVPIDAPSVLDVPDASLPPDEALDATWRADLVARALARVEDELRRDGRDVVYAVFRDYFLDAAPDVDYRVLASRHGISTVDVSNFLARAKNLYRSHLRSIVLDTVQGPDDLDEELRWLFGKDAR